MSKDRQIVIGFGPYARSGKDFAVEHLVGALGRDRATRVAFADELKRDIDPFLVEHFGISAFTTNPEEKKIIRPLLIAYGCQRRAVEPDVWIRKVEENFPDTQFVFISDVRFDNEVEWVQRKLKGRFVFVDLGAGPGNEEEAKNGPPLALKADCCVWNDFSSHFLVEVERAVRIFCNAEGWPSQDIPFLTPDRG